MPEWKSPSLARLLLQCFWKSCSLMNRRLLPRPSPISTGCSCDLARIQWSKSWIRRLRMLQESRIACLWGRTKQEISFHPEILHSRSSNILAFQIWANLICISDGWFRWGFRSNWLLQKFPQLFGHVNVIVIGLCDLGWLCTRRQLLVKQTKFCERA